MAKFKLAHEIDCPEEDFFRVFFDEAYNLELYRQVLGFPVFEILSRNETERELSWRFRAQPKLELPGPVERLLGKNFGYVEEGTLDKGERTYRYVMIPNTLADKLRNAGSVRVETAGEGRSRRVVEISTEAKVFGVGGIVESLAEKVYRDSWNRSAAFMSAFCARGR